MGEAAGAPPGEGGGTPQGGGHAGRRRDPLIGPGGKVDPRALAAAVPVVRPSDDDDAAVVPAPGDDDSDDSGAARVTFSLRRDLSKRLDKYLTDRITFMSRAQLQRLIEAGDVRVNDRPAKASTMLRAGDRVDVWLPPPPGEDVPPQDIPLRVLFEDAHLVVIDKDPDIIVHPARSHVSGTMINALAHHFRTASSGALSGVGREFARPGVVHRLDRDTTGVIVFAKDDEAHWKLARQFEARTVDKRYVAVALGHVEPDVDVVELPIGPHPSRLKGYREKHVVRHDHLGKPAVTIVRVLGRYGPPGRGTDDAPRCSVVEVELKTGRTHQIRVHLSHLGWPLLGDDMYGARPVVLPGERAPFARQALHAALLGFRHPISGEHMAFRAPLPADLAGVLRVLRSGPDAREVSPPGARLTIPGLLGEA